MSMFAWLRRSRRPVSPPDASAGRSAASCQRTSSCRGLDFITSVAAAAARPLAITLPGLRAALAAVLLVLPLPGAFAPAALAQSQPTFIVTTGFRLIEGDARNHACHVFRYSGTQNSPLTVNLRISQTGDFLAPGETGDKTFVRNTADTESYSFTVNNDAVDEPDGTITCTLLPGSGYAIASDLGSFTEPILDDDPSYCQMLCIAVLSSAASLPVSFSFTPLMNLTSVITSAR